MKYKFYVGLIVLLCVIFNTISADLNLPGDKKANYQKKTWSLYAESEKSPGSAFVLSIIPSMGHAYAGDWGRGLPFVLTDILGLALIGSGTTQVSTTVSTPGGDATIKGSQVNSQYYIGIGIIIIGHIWSAFDAAAVATDHNNKLKEALDLSGENPY